jgi:hypothetical protein
MNTYSIVAALKLLIAAIVLYGLWQVSHQKWQTVIEMDADGIRSHKGIPKARESRVLAFLTHDVVAEQRITIRATRCRNGYLRMRISGSSDPGTTQQIRNFLVRNL